MNKIRKALRSDTRKGGTRKERRERLPGTTTEENRTTNGRNETGNHTDVTGDAAKAT